MNMALSSIAIEKIKAETTVGEYTMSAKTFNIPLSIDYPYNPGEWRLSRQVTGPRGGKSWQKIYSTPATGGYLPDARLEPGEYKVTYWSNGRPYSYRFAVTEDGQRIDYPDL